jgi:hypothetical protein
MRWEGHVASMGAGRGVYRVLLGRGDPGLDWRVILRRIFRKWDVRKWIGLSWLRIGTVGGHLCMR